MSLLGGCGLEFSEVLKYVYVYIYIHTYIYIYIDR